MNVDNDELAEYLAGGSLDEGFEYRMKKRELGRDTRINKDSFIDVNAAYKDLKSWQNTENYHITNIAKNLLSSDFEISENQLTTALKNNHNLNDSECRNVLRNLANESDVEVRRGTFDKVVKLRRRS